MNTNFNENIKHITMKLKSVYSELFFNFLFFLLTNNNVEDQTDFLNLCSIPIALFCIKYMFKSKLIKAKGYHKRPKV